MFGGSNLIARYLVLFKQALMEMWRQLMTASSIQHLRLANANAATASSAASTGSSLTPYSILVSTAVAVVLLLLFSWLGNVSASTCTASFVD